MHLYIIAQLLVVFGDEALTKKKKKKTQRMVIRLCIGIGIAKVWETSNSGLAKFK